MTKLKPQIKISISINFPCPSSTHFPTREAFVACVLLASWWMPQPPFMHQELDLLDLFAGKARISRAGELLGYQCRCMDILYDAGEFSRRGSKSMDLLGSAGLGLLSMEYFISKLCNILFSPWGQKIIGSQAFLARLAIMLVLSATSAAALLATLGVLCSSWVSINRGTSKRTWLNPEGDCTYTSVLRSNMLTARHA